MKKNAKHIYWLYQQLPDLIKQGILTSENGEALRQHYGEAKSTSRMSLLLSLFGVLGAFCIGLGIILIFAYNWDGLSRFYKIVLSYTPLAISWLLVAKTAFSKKSTQSFREGVAVFNVISVAASIALISQAFHMPGDFQNFVFVWMLLSLPVIYLLHSNIVCILFLAGLTWWAGASQNSGGHALLFWPLALLTFPYLRRRIQDLRQLPSLSTAWILWSVCICFTVSLGVSMEKIIPGLWMIVYASFFAVLFLGGSLYAQDLDSQYMPFRRFGLMGLVVLSYILSYRGWWTDIGFSYYRSGARFHMWASSVDYFFLGVLLSLSVILFIKFIRSNDKLESLYALLPFSVTLFYLLDQFNISDLVPTTYFNLHFLILGLIAIRKGMRDGRMIWMNAGLVILTVLIWTRFIDSSIGILGRAMVFILVGVAFLSVNKIIAKKWRVIDED